MSPQDRFAEIDAIERADREAEIRRVIDAENVTWDEAAPGSRHERRRCRKGPGNTRLRTGGRPMPNEFGADEFDFSPESEPVSAAFTLDTARKTISDLQIEELTTQTRLKEIQSEKVKAAAALRTAQERIRAMVLNLAIPALPKSEVAKPVPVAQAPAGVPDVECTWPQNPSCRCTFCSKRFIWIAPPVVAPPEAQLGNEIRDARVQSDAEKAALAEFQKQFGYDEAKK